MFLAALDLELRHYLPYRSKESILTLVANLGAHMSQSMRDVHATLYSEAVSYNELIKQMKKPPPKTQNPQAPAGFK